MKKYIVYILVVIGVVGLKACDDMNSLHEAYLKEGPVIYRAKADSIYSYPGDERVQFNWILSNDRKIVKTIFSWDNGESEKVVAVQRTNATDTFRVIIDGLDERAYIFDIVNTDEQGNRSLPVNVFVNVYGTVYKSGLETRQINNLTVSGSGVALISWQASNEGDVYTEISYSNMSGGTTVLNVLPYENNTELSDFKPGGTLFYQTFYIPETDAIDEFPAPIEELVLPGN